MCELIIQNAQHSLSGDCYSAIISPSTQVNGVLQIPFTACGINTCYAMKFVFNYIVGCRFQGSTHRLFLSCVFIVGLLFAEINQPVLAQNNLFKEPTWWIGTSAGANLNLYHGSVQQVTPDLAIPTTFQNTTGTGLFAFPVLEFHRPGTRLGFLLNAGYESRRGKFDETFSTKLAYITLEPSIRLNLFNSPFYLFSGPRIAFNIDQRFTYRPETNSDEIGGLFSNVKQSVISMQFGGGYDWTLTAAKKKTQIILSPFVSFHPYFGQNPRTIESWNLTTLRGGIALKFGKGKKMALPQQTEIPVAIAVEPDTSFILHNSDRGPVEPTEIAKPLLHNHVYFNTKSDEATNANAEVATRQLKGSGDGQQSSSPQLDLTGSVSREIMPRDNFLNMLGELMMKNPSNGIMLIGESPHGAKAQSPLAESVKIFLVGVYGIDASRIEIKSQKRLKFSPHQPGNVNEIALLAEGDQRILIVSNSQDLQVKFRGGNGTPMKPLRINAVQETDAHSYITFVTEGANEVFSTWTLEIKDYQGKVNRFGPFDQEFARIPAKSILGEQNHGRYEITMIGALSSGQILKKDTTAYFSRWTPPATDYSRRFSISYEYNHSKAIQVYNSYLTDVITPAIPAGGKVAIHGHSENIGLSDYDLKLFLTRTNDAKRIIENALAKAGRTDVQVEVYGYGNNPVVAPFGKASQSKRLHNRTIFIEIVPGD